jgi:para-nitrobenzyl esterase
MRVRLRYLVLPVCWLLIAVTAGCSGGDDDGGAESDDRAGDGAAASPADPLEITTELGTVRGAESDVDGVRAFLALPYAAPPTGDDRWRPPQPREPYDGTFDATRPGGSCPQEVGGSTARFTVIPDPVEDCLTVSLWSPDDARDLPVMVWIHGGGLRAGSAHQPYYQGDDLAAEGVVVVGVNYRLGPFGFLATGELEDESDDGSYGNYGLADQTAALEWVQQNVAAFGGDPDNVTIFGESAGGGSVCAHLASPASDGLFDHAVIQSGGGCNRLQDGDEAQAAGERLVRRLGCDDIACLRRLPTERILGVDSGFGSFVNDGVRLPETGLERAERGDLDGIEVIIGSNADEAALFTIGTDEPADAGLRDLFAEYSDDPDALLGLYPAADYETNLARYNAMQTDVRFVCPTLAFAEAARNDTYVYHFTYESPDERFSFGPVHGAELAFLFAHPEGISGVDPGLSGGDEAVSAGMQAAWAALARDGVPGVEDLWRPYADGGRVTVLDDPFRSAAEIRDGRCDRVDELAEVRTGP